MKIKVKLGDKGRLVIPKVIRESIGLKTNGSAILEVKERVLEIRPLSREDLVQKSRDKARKFGGDIRKLGWIYGDKLYGRVFQS